MKNNLNIIKSYNLIAIKSIITFIFLYLILFIPIIKGDELYISAILYDPLGSDTGKEWVEIHNPTDEYINFYNYSFWSGDGAKENKWKLELSLHSYLIEPNGFFVIGESDVIPKPHIIKNLDLQNGPDAARLMKEEEIIDLLGWGEHTIEEYYLEEPAEDVSDGSCLKRINFTGVNSKDFIGAECIPNGENSINIPIFLEILSSDFTIINTTIEDDLEKEGIQIIPYKDRNASFIYEIDYSGNCSSMNITIESEFFTNHKLTLENEICILNVSILVEKGILPDNYPLNISLADDYSHLEILEIIEIVEIIGFEIDFSILNFSSMKDNSLKIIDGDLHMDTPLKPTIYNKGNVPLNISIISKSIPKVSLDYKFFLNQSDIHNNTLDQDNNENNNNKTIKLNPMSKAGITFTALTTDLIGIIETEIMIIGIP